MPQIGNHIASADTSLPRRRPRTGRTGSHDKAATASRVTDCVRSLGRKIAETRRSETGLTVQPEIEEADAMSQEQLPGDKSSSRKITSRPDSRPDSKKDDKVIAVVVRQYGTGLYRAIVSPGRGVSVTIGTFDEEVMASERIAHFWQLFRRLGEDRKESGRREGGLREIREPQTIDDLLRMMAARDSADDRAGRSGGADPVTGPRIRLVSRTAA